jgi:hypothetical protein
MRRFVLVPLIFLTGCATTVTSMHNGCMQQYHDFLQQAACIQGNINASPSLKNDTLIQEYAMTAGQLEKQVRAGKLSDDEARLRLTEKLNQVRERDIAEQAQEAEIFSAAQRTAPRFTDCSRNAGDLRCVTY